MVDYTKSLMHFLIFLPEKYPNGVTATMGHVRICRVISLKPLYSYHLTFYRSFPLKKGRNSKSCRNTSPLSYDIDKYV